MVLGPEVGGTGAQINFNQEGLGSRMGRDATECVGHVTEGCKDGLVAEDGIGAFRESFPWPG